MALDENGFLIPRKEGYAWSETGESGYQYAIYSRKEVEQYLLGEGYGNESIDSEDAIAKITPMRAHYGRPGEAFRHAPIVKVGKRNVMYRQFTGYDI